VKNAFRINRFFLKMSRETSISISIVSATSKPTLFATSLSKSIVANVHALTSSYRVVVAHDNKCTGTRL